MIPFHTDMQPPLESEKAVFSRQFALDQSFEKVQTVERQEDDMIMRFKIRPLLHISRLKSDLYSHCIWKWIQMVKFVKCLGLWADECNAETGPKAASLVQKF